MHVLEAVFEDVCSFFEFRLSDLHFCDRSSETWLGCRSRSIAVWAVVQQHAVELPVAPFVCAAPGIHGLP